MIIITQKNIIQISIKSRKKKQTAGDCDKTVDSQTSTSTHQNVSYAHKNDIIAILFTFYY